MWGIAEGFPLFYTVLDSVVSIIHLLTHFNFSNILDLSTIIFSVLKMRKLGPMKVTQLAQLHIDSK